MTDRPTEEEQLLADPDFLTSMEQFARGERVPATTLEEESVECYRCLVDERTRGIVNLSLSEMYPPDHADHCTAKDAPTP